MSAVFITSTGTDVGKTFIARGLIRHIRDQERMVDAVKPVVSGFLPRKAVTSDPGLLLTALGRPATMAEITRISPWRFAAPLSPDLAAQKEDRQIDFDALVAFSRQAIKAAPGVLLIEGVGGVMVPLDDRHTVLDWIVHSPSRPSRRRQLSRHDQPHADSTRRAGGSQAWGLECRGE